MLLILLPVFISILNNIFWVNDDEIIIIKHCRNVLGFIGEYHDNRRLWYFFFRLEYDYRSVKYPLPFDVLYNNSSSHYTWKCPFRNARCELPKYNVSEFSSDLLFLTGSSSNHYFGLANCILNTVRLFPFSSILVFNFGFNDTYTKYLQNIIHTVNLVHRISRAKAYIFYIEFNYNNMPEWMTLSESERCFRGGYAWKTIGILDVYHSWGNMIIWQDAGNYIHDPGQIEKGILLARIEGFYAPTQPINIRRKMSNKSFYFLKKYIFTNYIVEDGNSLAAGLMIFDYNNLKIRYSLMDNLKKCAFTKKCMLPNGECVARHLPEQSVIGIAIHTLNLSYSANYKFDYHPRWREEKQPFVTRNYETERVKYKEELSIQLPDIFSNMSYFSRTMYGSISLK